MSIKETPMMKQYLGLKKDYPNEFLFYRLGDFYEMFFDDAIRASKILNITLTKRNAKSEIPMAGIPFHAADNYISKLIKEGHSVVICEQTEDAVKGKIVNREVARIITPSTVSEEELISPNDMIKLVSVYKDKLNNYGLAELNMSNGQFYIYSFNSQNDLIDEINKINPSEILYPESNEGEFYFKNKKGVKSLNSSFYNLKNKFSLLTKQGLISKKQLSDKKQSHSYIAAESILSYILYTQKNSIPYIKNIKKREDDNKLELDTITIKNLELLKNSEGEKEKTLFSLMNKTKSALGARKLKDLILNPLFDKKEIDKRLNNVEILIKNNLYKELSSFFNSIPDIERILTRISLKTARPRDLSSLRNTLSLLPDLTKLLSKNKVFLSEIKSIPDYQKVYSYLQESITEYPPLLLRDGAVIRDGFDLELDELRKASEDSEDYLMELEEKEKNKTGFSKLKFSYNKVNGFYISVPNGKIKDIPSHFILKKSLKNENRYTIPELQSLEEKLLTANSKSLTKEKIVFDEILDYLYDEILNLSNVADFLAVVDVVNGFSKISKDYSYCRPTVKNKEFNIINGRHPVIEKYSDETFISNDFNFHDKKMILLTGANMGGKSTYMRQNALISIMAHMGCFVPADSAEIKLIDRIFTRIGSGDNLSDGLSTFMVEMKEMANILDHATSDSFVLVDEVGRGTSTFDGLSLAWAFADTLSKICDSVFSTHYLELTDLKENNKNIVNMHMEAIKFKDEIIFLYKIANGSTDQSYGLYVAKLAGIKESVIDKAKNKLNDLKNDGSINKILNKENYSELIHHIEAINVKNINDKKTFDLLIKIKNIIK